MVYFIIVYGSYGITSTKGKPGNFHCPSCAQPQTYRHRRVRRFFHIFFIPLIPLNLAGEYVECARCKGTYKLEVLDSAKTRAHGQDQVRQAAATEAQRGVRRVLAMMMLADGRVEESEIQTIMAYLSRVESRAVPRDEVLAELEAVRTDKTDAETYCRGLMGYLNLQGRRDVLDAAHAVAAADGHIDPSEQRMLERLGTALGLRPSEVAKSLSANQLAGLYAQAAKAPFCPTCGGQGRWIAEHGVWGCDRCRAAIPVQR